MKLRSLLAAAALTVLVPISVSAQSPIPGLYVTGVSSTGTRLAAGEIDPHWKIVGPDGLLDAVVVNNRGGTCRADGWWLEPNSPACWIWQTASGTPENITLRFRTTFNLTGFDAATASVTGAWAVDNTGLNVYLNGVATGNSIPGVIIENFGRTTPFSITSGFQSGLNTLDFEVQDVGMVGGFLINSISGTARTTSTVPEPGSFALVGAGLLALGVAARRRRTA